MFYAETEKRQLTEKRITEYLLLSVHIILFRTLLTGVYS